MPSSHNNVNDPVSRPALKTDHYTLIIQSVRGGKYILEGKFFLFAHVVTVALLAFLLGSGVYWFWATIDRSSNPFVDPDYRLSFEKDIVHQKKSLADLRIELNQQLDVLGREVGKLQAQSTRIHAAGVFIANNVDVSLSEFQFDLAPSIGGYGQQDESPPEAGDIQVAITQIQQQFNDIESQLSTMHYAITQSDINARLTPSGWPVKGGWLSSRFGQRMHPVTGRRQFHRGVDIPGFEGADVLAVADGVVTRSERQPNYGWLVELAHGNTYHTLYAHNRKNTVKVGDLIQRGQKIAELGNTGLSTGPHIHFEISKNGRQINPIKFLYSETNHKLLRNQ